MLTIGIDLAGVAACPTGFCILNEFKAETNILYIDEDIIKKTVEYNPALVAIDAPLWLPLGRKSLEEKDTNHLRDSDRELLKKGIRLFPPTLGPMRKLTARGIILRETLENFGFKVIEAYPGGAQDIWSIPRKHAGARQLRAGLEKIGLKGLTLQMSHHELDAATIAFVAKLHLEGETVIYGNPEQGIVMPKDRKTLERNNGISQDKRHLTRYGNARP